MKIILHYEFRKLRQNQPKGLFGSCSTTPGGQKWFDRFHQGDFNSGRPSDVDEGAPFVIVENKQISTEKIVKSLRINKSTIIWKDLGSRKTDDFCKSKKWHFPTPTTQDCMLQNRYCRSLKIWNTKQWNTDCILLTLLICSDLYRTISNDKKPQYSQLKTYF